AECLFDIAGAEQKPEIGCQCRNRNDDNRRSQAHSRHQERQCAGRVAESGCTLDKTRDQQPECCQEKLSPINLTQHLVDHASCPSGFEASRLPASLAITFRFLLRIPNRAGVGSNLWNVTYCEMQLNLIANYPRAGASFDCCGVAV